MNTRSLVLIAFAILFAQLVCASDVVDLTEKDFDTQTSQGDWLIEFFAPWCGHCKKLAPIYEEVATKLKGTVNVAKVDCTVHKGLQDRFGIRGFPTIKFIKGGQLYDYSDKRELDSFVAYVESGYEKVTPKAVPRAAEAATPPPAPAAPAEPVKREGSDVVVLTNDNFEKLTATGDWLLEFYAPWCGHCKNLAPVYENIATALKGKVNVAKIDCTSEEDLRTRFNIKGYPTIKFLKEGKLYQYQGARTGEAMITFVTSEYSSVTSEPLPKAGPSVGTSTSGSTSGSTTKRQSDVVVLTDDTFTEKTSEGVWLVEFYAPWCGHCKNLAPTYERVATSLKSENINVAKIDCITEKGVCDANGIRGFPTIYLFRDGFKYEYKGDRSLASFTSFSKEGWQEVTGEIPGQKNAFKETMIEIVKRLEGILSINIWVIVAGCIFFGLVLGVIIILLTAPSLPAAAGGTAPAAATTGEDEDDHTKKD